MNRATRIALVALAVLIFAFVATWVTIPNKERRVGTLSIAYPARVFAVGMLTSTCTSAFVGRRCTRFRHNVIRRSDISALERRVKAIFGGAAAVVALVGVALGAGRRPRE